MYCLRENVEQNCYHFCCLDFEQDSRSLTYPKDYNDIFESDGAIRSKQIEFICLCALVRL